MSHEPCKDLIGSAYIVMDFIAHFADANRLPQPEGVFPRSKSGLLPRVALEKAHSAKQSLAWARKLSGKDLQIHVSAYSHLRWARVRITGTIPAGPPVLVEQTVQTNLIPGMHEGEIHTFDLAEFETVVAADVHLVAGVA